MSLLEVFGFEHDNIQTIKKTREQCHHQVPSVQSCLTDYTTNPCLEQHFGAASYLAFSLGSMF